MPHFDFPYSQYPTIGIREGVDAQLVNPIIKDFPFFAPQPHPARPQRRQTFGAIVFSYTEMTETLEKGPRPRMKYPVQQFFDCHKKFSEGMLDLTNQNRSYQHSSSNLFDSISEIISEYDQSLIHLSDDILDVFFDYTDLLEAVLLASKRRSINVIDIKDILVKLSNYYSKIYSLMISGNCDDISSILEELSHIKEEICNRQLMPSDEEYDAEISEITSTMNDREREDLAHMLRN
jgi:hypothetical protein